MFIIIGLSFGVVVFVLLTEDVFLQTDESDIKSALRFLSLVMSILTGFSISTITSIGDQKLYVDNWRVASVHRNSISSALERIVFLVYAYLVTIMVAFGSYLADMLCESPTLYRSLVRTSLSLGLASLTWSLVLPVVVFKAKKAVLNAIVAEASKSTN